MTVLLRFIAQVLEDILGRPASSVFDLAVAAVSRSLSQNQTRAGSLIGSASDSEFKSQFDGNSYDLDSDIPLALDGEGESGS